MKIVSIWMCCLACAISAAEEIPGASPVPSGQLNGGQLLLPVIGGSVGNSGDKAKWLQMPMGPKILRYVTSDTPAQNSENPSFVVITVMLDTKILTDQQFQQALDGVQRGGVNELKSGGMSDIKVEPRTLDTQRFGRLSGFSISGTLGAAVVLQSYLHRTGEHLVIFSCTSQNAAPSPFFKTVIESASLPPAPSLRSRDAMLSLLTNPALGTIAYFFWGALIGGVCQLIAKWVFKKRINGPAIAVFVVLASLISFLFRLHGIVGVEFSAEQLGREIGAAVIPIVIFTWMASQHKSEKKKETSESTKGE